MPLDLLVAGLVPPIDAPPEMRALRLPALEKWLARADLARSEARTATAWLAAAFSLGDPAPVAALSLAADDPPGEGSWMRADPAHVRIDRERTSLHAGAALGIGAAEAAALVEALNGHFRDDGLEFLAPAPERWYVRVPAEEIPATTSLEEALGRDVQKLIPAARGRIKWPAAITEIQMIFAAHEVNTRREGEGRPAINTVWLWGGGAHPREVASPYAVVYADEPFARGLARSAGVDARAAAALLADIDGDAVRWVLATSDAPLRAVIRGNAGEWSEAVRKLDEAWFAGLGDAIGRFGTVRIVLPSATGTIVGTLDRGARWRLFRRTQALAAYA